jgi:hypothetical protein
MANPSQSQDVEHQSPRPESTDPRQRSSPSSGRGEFDREARPRPGQQKGDGFDKPSTNRVPGVK